MLGTNIKQISLLFKVDYSGKLALILCTNLQILSEEDAMIKTVSNDLDIHPLGSEYNFSEDITGGSPIKSKEITKNIKSMFKVVPKSARPYSYKKKEICAFCSKSTINTKHEMTYKRIIDMHICYNGGGSEEVPKPLRSLMPFITKTEYVFKAAQKTWLTNKAPCCDNCFFLIGDL